MERREGFVNAEVDPGAEVRKRMPVEPIHPLKFGRDTVTAVETQELRIRIPR